MARTLAELISRARTYSDQTRSRFCSDAEVAEMVNAGWSELYSLLVSTFEDYFITDADIALVSGTEEYDLPDGDPDPIVYKLRGLDFVASATDSLPLRPFLWSERGRYTVPDFSGTVRVNYIPICPTLVTPPVMPDVLGASEIDTLPDEVKPGWDELIALEAGIQMLAKEQNESSFLMARKNDKIEEIQSMAPVRDADEAPRMIVRTGYLDEGDDDDIGGWRVGWGRAMPTDLRYCLRGSKIRFRSAGEF